MTSFLERSLERNRKLMEEIGNDEADDVIPMIVLKPQNDLIAKMHAQLANAARDDLEQIPRKTLVKMFTTADLEVHFTFKVELGGGNNYIQAMRQVLSRVRKKAVIQKMELEDFKLFEIKVENKEDCDEVTLVRSAVMTQKEESVYTDLLSKMAVFKKS